MTENAPRYWIAINGSTCALRSFPLLNPTVIPTPQLLLGFLTLEEAQKAQKICLTAPIPEVKKFFKRCRRDAKSGRVVYLRPSNPEPPTRQETLWLGNLGKPAF